MSALRLRAFRNLLVGGTISALGDVFFVVALPWIVLGLSHSGVALGGILMAVAVPRAALMLFGGAISDRVPARTVLLVGNSVVAACVGAVTVAAALHVLAMPTLFALAVVFGIADAFNGPALKVLVPSIVPQEQIHAANSLLQTATQLCMLGGGALAGISIQAFGIVPALALDACSFIFLIGALLTVRANTVAVAQTANVLSSVRDGIAYAFSDPSIRLLLAVIAVVNVCLTGASQVGIAALIHARFDSVAFYGTLVTLTAIGSLAGVALAGVWRPAHTAAALLAAGGFLGICIGTLALPLSFLAICGVLFACGTIAGFINIHVISALQRQVAPGHLGRVMSLIGLASVGLAPLSLAIAGVIAQINVNTLFIASAASLIGVACIGIAQIAASHARSRALNARS